MTAHAHEPLELGARYSSFVERRWGLVLVGLTIALAVGSFGIVITSVDRTERNALMRMNPLERRALYLQTRRNAEELCAQPATDSALADRCIDAARYLSRFPECDESCAAFARAHDAP